MKRTSIKAILACAVAAMGLVFVVSACTNDTPEPTPAPESAPVEATEHALLTTHAALGQDLSGIDTISWATCGSCHGGYEGIVKDTEAFWAGTGQITAANPHASHASAAYACDMCHSFTAEPINQCNQCHGFDSPAGWLDPDPTTTVYGVGQTEPMF